MRRSDILQLCFGLMFTPSSLRRQTRSSSELTEVEWVFAGAIGNLSLPSNSSCWFLTFCNVGRHLVPEMHNQRDASNSSLSQTRSASSSLHDQNDGRRVTTRGAGRRLRASTACQICRARKVKCTNERPSCAGCVRLGCECRYPEPVKYMQPRYVAN